MPTSHGPALPRLVQQHRYEINQVVVDDQTVAARVTMTGTHTGEFLGVPASGRSVRYAGLDSFRCEERTSVEHWANSDGLGLLEQIGAIPSTNAWSGRTASGGEAH